MEHKDKDIVHHHNYNQIGTNGYDVANNIINWIGFIVFLCGVTYILKEVVFPICNVCQGENCKNIKELSQTVIQVLGGISALMIFVATRDTRSKIKSLAEGLGVLKRQMQKK